MLSIAQLATKRMKIIDEITEIRSMRKGVLIAKYQKVKHKNGTMLQFRTGC